MAKWRPEGWIRRYPENVVWAGDPNELFEAGADAMLKALLESQNSQPTIIHDLVKGEKRVGITPEKAAPIFDARLLWRNIPTSIFIPDEEVKP